MAIDASWTAACTAISGAAAHAERSDATTSIEILIGIGCYANGWRPNSSIPSAVIMIVSYADWVL
jgi:hypothetical protein